MQTEPIAVGSLRSGFPCSALPEIGPYVGLRPFDESDKDYFFGREQHIRNVLQKLSQQSFVAVIGLSGAGKSSLVLAGVLPQLPKGRMVGKGSDWVIVKMTPGNSPMNRLSDAVISGVTKYFNDRGILRQNEIDDWALKVPDRIGNGSIGLSQVLDDANLPPQTEVLVLVDQFEELFRFEQLSLSKGQAKADESEGLIQNLLWGTGKLPEPGSRYVLPHAKRRICVLITMRSEFLGDCARVAGLAEAVNEGMYLTPRLKEPELRLSIVLPAKRCGAEIDEALVGRLVNDVLNNQDQLPILQHILMRCWAKRDPKCSLNLELYDLVGGANALDQHLEEVLKELGAESGLIAEKLFKRITKPGSKARVQGEASASALRDPAPLDVICQQIGEDEEAVRKVINQFRRKDRAFLRPAEGEMLKKDSVIDITHESLIRHWMTLSHWVSDEGKQASEFLELTRLAEKADVAAHVVEKKTLVEARPGRELLRESELAEFRPYFEGKTWNKDWAERYGGNFERAEKYYKKSKDKYDEQKEKEVQDRADRKLKELKGKALRWFGASVSIFAVITAVWFGMQYSRKNQVIKANLFNQSIQEASREDLPMADRVPSALGALFLGAQLKGIGPPVTGGIAQIRQDQWELFSALSNSKNELSKPSEELNGQPVVGAGGTAVSPDRKWAAVVGTKGIAVWSLTDTMKFLLPLTNASKVRFSRNGKYLIATQNGGDHAEVEVFEIASEKPILRLSRQIPLGPRDEVAAAFFIGDSTSSVGVLTYNGAVHFFPPLKLDHPLPSETLATAALSEDLKHLLVSRVTGSNIIDLESGAVHDLNETFSAAVFFPASECIAASLADQGQLVILENPSGHRDLRECNPFLVGDRLKINSAISSLAVGRTPDGAYEVAAGTQVGTYVFGKGYESQPRTFVQDRRVNSVDFDEIGLSLVTAGADSNAHVFDVRTGIETARVAHQSEAVLASFVARQSDKILSVSQDGVALLTSVSNQLVKRDWYDNTGSTAVSKSASDTGGSSRSSQNTCEPAHSAVTAIFWVWDCGSDLFLKEGLSHVTQARLGEGRSSQNTGTGAFRMTASADGSTLVWIDQELCRQSQKWGVVRVLKLGPGANPDGAIENCLQSDLEQPLLAVSSDGRWIGIANFESHAWRLHFLHLESQNSVEGVEFTDSSPPEYWDQILGLAIENEGTMLVATTQAPNASKLFLCSPRKPCNDGTEVPSKQSAVMSVAFIEDAKSPGDPWVAYSQGNGSSVPLLWVQKLSFITASNKHPEVFDERTARRVPNTLLVSQIFPSNDGSQFAVIANGIATFFTTGDSTPYFKQLREPGEIQSVAFLDKNNIVTSVLVKPTATADGKLNATLTKITHDLREGDHAKWICEHLAKDDTTLQRRFATGWENENLGTAPDLCGELKKMTKWPSDGPG
jgi:WD40 repeat protein/energy-coupling factor transporter ATP-binding protein EcfA2